MRKLLTGIFFPLAVFSYERQPLFQDTKEFFGEELHLATELQQQKKTLQASVKIEPIFCEDGTWRIFFKFPEAVSFKKDVREKSIYIEFNQSIDSPDLQKVQEKLSYVINRFSNGYNTLYLTGENPIFFNTEAIGNVFELDIIPDFESVPKPTRALQIAQARQLIEMRDYKNAASMLSCLRDNYPLDKDVGVWLSSLEGLYPHWQKQVHILENLNCEYPCDEDIQTLLADARSPHTSYLTYERQVQDMLTQAVYQINRIQGEAIARQTDCYTLYIGAQYQLWRGHISQLVNSQGNGVGFEGTRNQAALYLRNEWENGTWVSAWLYGQEGNFYGGSGLVGCLVPPLQGSFWIRGDLHQPYWEIYETFAFHGRQDRIECHLDSVYNRYVNWAIGGGARRVGIQGVTDGYISMLANAELFINFVITNPIIAFNYGLDAEYVLHRKKEIGSNGETFNPVPLVSFEFHSVRAYIFYTWSDRLFINFFAGETFNRLGIQSPTAGAEIKYVYPCRVELLISAARIPSTTSPGTAEDIFTGSITGRF